MNAIHIHTQLDSTTVHLPQVEPLLGKRVEIIVREEPDASLPAGMTLGTGDWQAFQNAADKLRNSYDFDAVKDLDEVDLKDAMNNAKLWE